MSQIDGIGYCEKEGPSWRPHRSSVVVYERVAPNLKARMAKEMVERWGCVAGMPDGEDSSGRQRWRLRTPEELAQHACDAADRERGWLLDLPEPAVASDETDETD